MNMYTVKKLPNQQYEDNKDIESNTDHNRQNVSKYLMVCIWCVIIIASLAIVGLLAAGLIIGEHDGKHNKTSQILFISMGVIFGTLAGVSIFLFCCEPLLNASDTVTSEVSL